MRSRVLSDPRFAKAALSPPAGLLRAEIERLSRELADARARFVELELRIVIDPLTSSTGAASTLNHVLAELRQPLSAQAAPLYVDVNCFKAINDQHRHAAGDELFKPMDGEPTTQVRAFDMVGRIPGDEFGKLMWNVGRAAGDIYAQERVGV